MIEYAINAQNAVKENDILEAKRNLIKLYYEINSNPKLIKKNLEYSYLLGTSYLMMVDYQLSDDDDILESFATLSYFFLTKAHKLNPKDFEIIIARIFLLQNGIEDLIFPAIKILNIENGYSIQGQYARENGSREIKKMELFDLILNTPTDEKKIGQELFGERSIELAEYFSTSAFVEYDKKKKMTLIQEAIKEGEINHQKFYKFLEKKFLVDLSFKF